MKIAVLDTTHAGCIIAEHYALAGHDVTAIDVYHTTTTEQPETYTLTRDAEGTFDLVVTPVHLPPRHFKNIHAQKHLSHHEAVGQLIKEKNINAVIFEITGTRSKTTTALTLSHILQEKYNVTTNTSAGLMLNNRKIAELSTAPGNVLQAIKLTENLHPEIYIFEISLGGTTQADFGILTTLENDYLIAEATKPASSTKIKTLIGKHTHPIVNSSTCSQVKKEPKTIFGSTEDNVYIKENILHYRLNKHRGTMHLPKLFYPDAYKTGIGAAVAAALHLMTPDEIQSALLNFKGVTGRMQFDSIQGRTLIDNSNSGMRSEELETLIQQACTYGNVFLIHGEDGKVCERLDHETSKKIIKKWQHKLIGVALVGPEFESAGLKFEGTGLKPGGTYTAKNVDDATRIALQHTTTGDVILSCVKCFR
ncbi:MAG: Coenzyme F(430) synthetase [Candidatus Argoarchaeum ethanivorans]|uniref:Coenzyme F(430) synthetase n=1 Tax=Candidatus Argoarchaeum ethanivorans TaxID=2608793 RepID=A0A811ZZF4_9EURY|nr:MAG: Coenzyme F(430) synthetase [Candidatus Argoarchaeum ethanivorans]